MAYIRPDEQEFKQEELPPLPTQENRSILAPDGSTVVGPENNAPIATEANGLTVGRIGHIRGGQSRYNTLKGFFLGYEGGQYKFSIGDPSGNYLTWDGTTLSISANLSDYQVFTANGTWTKPSGLNGNETVLIKLWGGGGAGGGILNNTGRGGGGGGGGYNEAVFRANDLSATISVTVGAGGTGGTGDAPAGNNTTFGSYLTAYGGGGGAKGTAQSGGGGGGAGIIGAGSSVTGVTGGAGGGILGGAAGTDSNFGGGGGGSNNAGAFSVWGGGGGGSDTNVGNGKGGNSVYGGGGGAGADNGGTPAGGKALTYGGNGAAGPADNNNGNAGTAPGGGGSGARRSIVGDSSGGNGARGEVRVWVHR